MLVLKLTFARTPNHLVGRCQDLFCVSLPISGEETRRERFSELQLALFAFKVYIYIYRSFPMLFCAYAHLNFAQEWQSHRKLLQNANALTYCRQEKKCVIYTIVSAIKTSDESREQNSLNHHAPSSFCLSSSPSLLVSSTLPHLPSGFIWSSTQVFFFFFFFFFD